MSFFFKTQAELLAKIQISSSKILHLSERLSPNDIFENIEVNSFTDCEIKSYLLRFEIALNNLVA